MSGPAVRRAHPPVQVTVRLPQAPEGLQGSLQAFFSEVDHAAVMRPQQVEADRAGIEAAEQLLQRDEVITGFRHLLALERDHVEVHPVAGERQAGAVRLGKLSLMVREDQVKPTTVNVEFSSEVLHTHGRAFDVPARVAASPRAGPLHDVAILSFLPQGKIAWVALLGAHSHPGARFLVIGCTAGQPAVTMPAVHTEVDAALSFVSDATLTTLLDKLVFVGVMTI